ncbi:type III-B CRISPR-associated protein Cas10/Cmr2 [Myxococcota bacterium]|nr:type III-B CRISPR-associated protein Cas10/Cmr2 [Myxococcota bacterium]MBU1898334.1 type III-B CRISPR-associated protein Cas10/Cmr2 [Myxococcota bacterium]
MSHLLLISLGPVQDFIATARGCQDLWFGSFLLSELSRAVAESLESGGETLIFPGSLDEGAAVANKILARIKGDPRAVVEAAEAAMYAKINVLFRDVRVRVERAEGGDHRVYWDVAEIQIREELMEFFWVAVPEPEGAYHATRLRAETLLNMRKASRDWGPLRSARVAYAKIQRGGIPKSSLDGLRESVIDDAVYKDFDLERLWRCYGLNSQERLGGVGLLKRKGLQLCESDEGWRFSRHRPAFHGTSHLAAAPLLTRFARLGLKIDALISQLKADGVDLDPYFIRAGASTQAVCADKVCPPMAFAGVEVPSEVPRVFGPSGEATFKGYDGILLFEDRLSAIYQAQFKGAVAPTDAIDTLRGLLSQAGIGAPTPYYAMLLADGDKMGQAINAVGERPDGFDCHQRFSHSLEQFASGAGRTLSSFGGSLIYSGGDDVFGLLPLHTALACADQLRQDFNDAMLEAFPNDVLGGLALPTLSVGLAFVHHLTPMSRARKLAKEAEKAAKEKAGRNALAIVMDKRSGRELMIYGQWASGLLERLDHLCVLLRAERLPDGVAYELESLAAQFKGADADSVVKALARRIFDRKRGERGAQQIDVDVRRFLDEAMMLEPNAVGAVARLSQEVQIARLLLGAYEDAWGGV